MENISSDTLYPVTDHFDGAHFYNVNTDFKGRNKLLDVLQWKLKGGATKWPCKTKNSTIPELPNSVGEHEAFITFINHATHLVQLEGLNIITDPIFSKRVSPVSWLGPKRVRPPGIVFESLPKIDIVVISHNHYDHMDLPSIRMLWKRDAPLFIVPLGNGKQLEAEGVSRIIELDWWQTHSLNTFQSITLTPAQHWSGRTPFDHCKTLWGGYLITSKHLKIFFAGDTGYNNHFQEIRRRYGKMDISILPIGAYEPRWFMQKQHMNPSEAIQTHIDLGSKLSIGTHFGTFQLANEGFNDPVQHLREHLTLLNIEYTQFIAPEHGQTISYIHIVNEELGT